METSCGIKLKLTGLRTVVLQVWSLGPTCHTQHIQSITIQINNSCESYVVPAYEPTRWRLGARPPWASWTILQRQDFQITDTETHKSIKNALITGQGVRNSENPGFDKNPEIEEIQKSTLLFVRLFKDFLMLNTKSITGALSFLKSLQKKSLHKKYFVSFWGLGAIHPEDLAKFILICQILLTKFISYTRYSLFSALRGQWKSFCSILKM